MELEPLWRERARQWAHLATIAETLPGEDPKKWAHVINTCQRKAIAAHNMADHWEKWDTW